jgi:hypothetical protein
MYEPEIEYSCACGYQDYPGEELAACPECGSEDIEQEEHEREDSLDWDDLVENVTEAIRGHFKSFDDPPEKYNWVEYPYRENRILLENDHCQISISEYMGCGAVSVFESGGSEYPELAMAWTDKNFEKIQKLCEPFTDQLRKIATASNGEAFFEKV